MSAYIALTEVADFGFDASLTLGQIRQASALVDAYLQRPEGLVWTPDTAGNPCCMAGLAPSFTFTLAGGVTAGANVVASITPAIATADLVGDVLVLDRADPTKIEACIVTSVTAPGQIVLQRVLNAHNTGTSLDQGLLICEDRALPDKRSVARVSRLPIVSMRAVLGRYGYGRRSNQMSGQFQDVNLLATLQAFGGPPPWTPVDPAQVETSPATGEVWLPAGLLLSYFSDARLRYVAGFAQTSLPEAIKQATAQMIRALQSAGADLPNGIRTMKAGDTAIERFSQSNMDPDTRMMLAPYRARAFF